MVLYLGHGVFYSYHSFVLVFVVFAFIPVRMSNIFVVGAIQKWAFANPNVFEL
jgi:hypothetical protein